MLNRSEYQRLLDVIQMSLKQFELNLFPTFLFEKKEFQFEMFKIWTNGQTFGLRLSS